MAEPIKVSPQEQAQILMQALPHMLRYDDPIVVVKYGGHAMGDEDVARDFARDMVLLEQAGINPVVVHGGGPQIGAMLKKLGIKSAFRRRLARHRQAARWKLSRWCSPARSTSRSSASSTPRAGARSASPARTAIWCIATKVTRAVHDPATNSDQEVDFGFVGEPEKVDTTVLEQILGRELIPVLAPVGARRRRRDL